MKTKNKGILITLFLFLFSLLSIFIPAQAAQQTAVTVKSKTFYTDSKEFMTVKGLDSNKKVVWKYVTKKYPATELNCTKCISRKDKVYVFENSKVIVFRKKDGKRLWTSEKLSPAGHVYRFDKNNNLYVTGYYDQYIYKVSAKGKILWKRNTSKTGNYWPCKITVSDNRITVLYEMNSKDFSSDKLHKVILNSKNGKILKYSQIGRNYSRPEGSSSGRVSFFHSSNLFFASDQCSY